MPPDPSPAQPPADDPAWAEIDRCRALAYLSCEAYLHQHARDTANDRGKLWQRDYSGLNAYTDSIAPMRQLVARLTGISLDASRRQPAIGASDCLAETPTHTAERLILPIAGGPLTYAILMRPTRKPNGAGLLLQPDAGGTPEEICGLVGKPQDPYQDVARLAVERGFHVLSVYQPSGFGQAQPGLTTVPRGTAPGSGPNRLHRLALLGDTTLLGLQLMIAMAGLDYLASLPGSKKDRLTMLGFAQGGRLALYLAALDTRLRATVVSGYVCRRLERLIGPTAAGQRLDGVDESLFLRGETGLVSDADLISLVAPRALAVEAGKTDQTTPFAEAAAEVHLARQPYQRLGFGERFEFLPHDGGHCLAPAASLDFLQRQVQPKLLGDA